jgi:pyruvate,water dikinase
LFALLRNSRRSLVSLHGHEALAGLLIPEAGAATVTGASLALSALAQAKSEGVSLCDLVERDPVVLALVPPRISATPAIDALDGVEAPPLVLFGADTPEPDPAAVAREALRLRVRWVQELTARAAWELGRRLVDVGVLPSHESVRLLRLDELAEAVQRRTVPADLHDRVEPAGSSLPSRFRLSDDGLAVAVPASFRKRRRGAGADAEGVGAGGGVGEGPVHVGGADVPAGSVLVVGHLDPRLASVIPRLAGIVAETGNALSHLAILAREHRVPVVVGLPDATTRFADGARVVVDGQAGTVKLLDLDLETALVTTGAPS